MRQDPSDIANEARQMRIESDEHAVVITTVHRSKGLEFDYVLCPYLWADPNGAPDKNDVLVYHDQAVDGWVADQRGKDAPATALAAAAREHEAEALRLIYVAITRARHAVIMFLPPVKGLHNSALGRFLSRRFALGQSQGGKFSLPKLRERLESFEDPERSNTRVVDSIEGEPPNTIQEPQAVNSLSVRPLSRRVVNSWVASSFSALIAGLPAHTLSSHAEEGKDVDAQALPIQPSELGTAPARFSALPPGSASGDTLHTILECIDFVGFEPASDTIVAPLLARHGPTAQAELAKVQGDLVAVLEAPLLSIDPTFNLRSVDRRRRRSELQFSMGVGFDALGHPQKRVNVRKLAEALTPEATGLDETYAESVRQLKFEPLAGYLRGFIDLVFEHNHKTYVVDYKSTSISDKVAGFTPPLVANVVATNHYALQTALYSLVMHRYLRRRKPDYDYDRDFGGTLVVFLRGVSPTQRPGHSVYFHRASRASIDALDTLFSTAGVT